MKDLDHVIEEWTAIHGAIDKVLANGQDVESARVIDDHNLELLELTTILAADITGRYAHPFEITAADALMIELAGRQRMLTQKMAKDSCEIWTDYNAEAAKVDLEETMQIFEASLMALRYGMPEAGVMAAPTDIIEKDLDVLLSRWEVIKANQQTLVDGGELTAEQKTEIFHDLQIELADLDKLVADYKEYSQRAHGQKSN